MEQTGVECDYGGVVKNNDVFAKNVGGIQHCSSVTR